MFGINIWEILIIIRKKIKKAYKILNKRNKPREEITKVIDKNWILLRQEDESVESWRSFYMNLLGGGKEISSRARRAGSDGSMSASGSAGPGYNPRQGSKF